MTTTFDGAAVVVHAGYAAERVFRLMSFALALAALILLALNLPGAFAQIDVLTPLWTWFAVGSAAFPPLTTLILSTFARPEVVRRFWGIGALAMLAAYSSVPLALNGERIPADLGLPWLVQLSVLAGCSAALAWRPRYAIGYGIVLQCVFFMLVLFVHEPLPGNASGEAVEQVFFVAFFMSIAVALRRAGTLLDDAVASAVQEAQTASRSELRRAARQRVEMLVHDSVIVALLTYAAGSRPTQAATQAAKALGAIHDPHSSGLIGADRTPRQFAWELQATTTELDPEADFDYTVAGVLPVPADAADAVVEAASEALRNSVRHAPHGRPVERLVRVSVSDTGLQVLVLDDGEGFNLSDVNPTRLGVRSGILGRFRGLPGGRATVTSRVGYGTTVTIEWKRP